MSDINDDDDDDHYNDLSDLSDHDDSPNINNNNKNYDNDNNEDDNDTNEEVNRDPFDDDAHLLQLRIEASSLTLDEVGYDRDLNRINNPNPTDRKTLFKATLLRKQVDQIKGIVTPEDLERIQKGEKKSHSRRRRGGGVGNDDRNINNNETASPIIMKREIYQAPNNSNRRRNGNLDVSNEVKAEKVYDRRRQIPSFDNVQSNNNFPQPPTFDTSNGRRRGGRGRKDKKKDQSVMIKGIMQNPNRDMLHSKLSYNNSAVYLNPAAPEFTPPIVPKTADYANNTLFLNPAAPEFTPTFASKT